MPTSTARGQFPYPLGTDNWKLIEDYLRALAERNAAVSALYVESTAATRPAPGTPGRLHRATDTGTVTWDTGTAWDDVAVSRAGGSTITASAPAVRPLTVKAAAGQTANLAEFQNDTGGVVANIGAGGRISTSNAIQAGTAAFIDGQLGAFCTGPTNKGLVVRGAAGQTANLQEWQDSAGTVLSSVERNGQVNAPYISNRPADHGALNSTNLGVTATNATHRPLVVRGAASQTANLAEYQNSAGTVLASVSAAGESQWDASLSVTTATAGTGVLPSAPAGFLRVAIGGVSRRIPYYNA